MGRYSKVELSKAFNEVVKGQDWRDPICFVVKEGKDFCLYRKAIEDHTATDPVIKPSDQNSKQFIILSEGYRLGPAGDY